MIIHDCHMTMMPILLISLLVGGFALHHRLSKKAITSSPHVSRSDNPSSSLPHLTTSQSISNEASNIFHINIDTLLSRIEPLINRDDSLRPQVFSLKDFVFVSPNILTEIVIGSALAHDVQEVLSFGSYSESDPDRIIMERDLTYSVKHNLDEQGLVPNIISPTCLGARFNLLDKDGINLSSMYYLPLRIEVFKDVAAIESRKLDKPKLLKIDSVYTGSVSEFLQP